MNPKPARLVFAILAVFILPKAIIAGEDSSESKQYRNHRQAMLAQWRLKGGKDLVQRESALHQALELAENDRQRVDVHRAYLSLFAETDEPSRLFESTDFVVENAPYKAAASLAVSETMSIIRRKDWKSELLERYEPRLKDNPNDRIALVVLEKYYYTVERDYSKRIDMLDRLIALDEDDGEKADPSLKCDRAFSYFLKRDYKESAELYRSISNEYSDYQSFGLVKSAKSWEKARDFEMCLVDAAKADAMGPDISSKKNLYQWHRDLGELFLNRHVRGNAIKHLDEALKLAPIDAYKQQCQDLLADARALQTTPEGQ